MNRKQLVGTTEQRMQADGGSEVLAEVHEVWEEWKGQTVDDTDWGKGVEGQRRAREQAAVRRSWNMDMERDLDKVFDRG